MKRTKIIATVGPVTESIEQLQALYDNWVNIIRFNFSHAQYDVVEKIIERINTLNERGTTNLSIMLDTKWPEIRTWDVAEKVKYETWDIFKVVVDKNLVDQPKTMFCDYEFLLEDVNVGDIIRVDSWMFDIKVTEKHSDHLIVEALNGAMIWTKRHVNLPWVKLKLPGITEKDKNDILFGIQQGISFIAASFIRNKENIFELRDFLKQHNAEHIKIVSKIENQEAIENLDDIIFYSDGIMVARWDLWIEVAIEKLPIYQKLIVKKCRQLGKFVIIATHLLETMSDNPYPTRAEVSDIFNSVFQKADATMLSGETTTGKYPIKCVEMMANVIKEAEASIVYTHEHFSDEWLRLKDIEKKLMIKSAIEIWEQLWLKAVIIFSKSGLLARLVSAFRPNIQVHVFTNRKTTLGYMNSLFGVTPHYIDVEDHTAWIIDWAIAKLLETWELTSSDKIIALKDISSKWKEVSTMQLINLENYTG